ncbi:hypothetical protein PRIPAC_71314 [Pristionchus pacificus]|uniref:Serpentine receptor class gamma n=1 Tax=Pristionchus pacificus TaxID=54126 RepID=A0A2A6C1K6_PRIPA|nr:hypothetical protein PRIPAC_71314 [Pristionchus pacificus]|eukprot:PDM72006.1 G protein-coupled receptor [Pristionchus pacificus]
MRALAFNVLNSRCNHFNVSDAFIKTPLIEGILLAIVLRQIRGKWLYFAAPTDENTFRPTNHLFTIPISIVNDLDDSNRNMIQIGWHNQIREHAKRGGECQVESSMSALTPIPSETAGMRSIPPDFLPMFFVEAGLCVMYTVFMLVLMRNRERFFKTPFFKLFCSAGFAGMWMIEAHWFITLFMRIAEEKKDDIFVYISQVLDGSAVISNTISKFIFVINRFSVLANFRSPVETAWSSRSIYFLASFQFAIPLLPHLYFVTRPLNFKNGYFDALDFETGSIYRGVTGSFYGVYGILAIGITILSMVKLQQLWSDNKIYSIALYKQQRSLTIFAVLTTAFHILFAVHQFVWTYAYLDGSRAVLVVIRSLRPYVFDGTVFVDPLVLFVLLKPVRTAFFGRFMKKKKHNNNPLDSVCKFTKQLADATALSRNNIPSIDCLTVGHEGVNEVVIDFFFDKIGRTDRLQSKLCFVSAVNYLQIYKFNIDTKHKMCISMTPIYTEEFFHHRTHVIPNAKCEALRFFPAKFEVFSLASSFFKGRSVQENIVDVVDSKKECRLHTESCWPTSSKRHAFLLQLAAMVDTIALATPSNCYSPQNRWADLASMKLLALKILSSRCLIFDASDGFIEMSGDDELELSNILWTLRDSKRFLFTAPTSEIFYHNFKDRLNIPISVACHPEMHDRNIIKVGEVEQLIKNMKLN